MEELKKLLIEKAGLPRMSAVQYTKQNEFDLVRKFTISRGELRRIAVLLDQQLKVGFKPSLVEKEKKEERTLKLAKAKVKPKSKKADAEPPKKEKTKPKAKVKKKAKPKSKKKP